MAIDILKPCTFFKKYTVEKLLSGHAVQEFSAEQLQNAQTLCDRVNAIVFDYVIDTDKPIPAQNSGYRSPEENAAVPNAAKASKHMSCEAIDLDDDMQDFKNWVKSKPAMLDKHDLYMEGDRITNGSNKNATPTWCHLDIYPRKNRIFNI